MIGECVYIISRLRWVILKSYPAFGDEIPSSNSNFKCTLHRHQTHTHTRSLHITHIHPHRVCILFFEPIGQILSIITWSVIGMLMLLVFIEKSMGISLMLWGYIHYWHEMAPSPLTAKPTTIANKTVDFQPVQRIKMTIIKWGFKKRHLASNFEANLWAADSSWCVPVWCGQSKSDHVSICVVLLAATKR